MVVLVVLVVLTEIVHGSLDAWEPHPHWKVGDQKVENIDYTQLEPREYFAKSQISSVPGVYSVSVTNDDLSGKVL